MEVDEVFKSLGELHARTKAIDSRIKVDEEEVKVIENRANVTEHQVKTLRDTLNDLQDRRDKLQEMARNLRNSITTNAQLFECLKLGTMSTLSSLASHQVDDDDLNMNSDMQLRERQTTRLVDLANQTMEKIHQAKDKKVC